MRATTRGAAILAATCTTLCHAPEALGQSAPERAAAAQALFDEAMDLLDHGHTAEACPKLEEAQRLDPGMGTQFRLAGCHERLGRSASAWALYLEVAEAARTAHLPERERVARARANALEPRLSRIAIQVAPRLAGVAGLEIRRNGASIGATAWGTAMPVDPGEHTITASAPGKRAWGTVVVVGAQAEAITVNVPPLEDAPRTPMPTPRNAAEHRSERRSIVPAMTLGGVATVGVGIGALLVALSGRSRSEAAAMREGLLREGHGCVPGAVNFGGQRCGALAARYASSDRLQDVAIVSLALGGAAVASALTFVLWPSAHRTAQGGLSVAPRVGSREQGISISGSF